MKSQEYDYKTRTTRPDGNVVESWPSSDPHHAGRVYRDARAKLPETGGKVELLRRPLGPWETVESEECPRKEE